MLGWIKKKSEVDRLKDRYAFLMKRSFKTSLHNRKESERLNKEARRILRKLKEYQGSHNTSIID